MAEEKTKKKKLAIVWQILKWFGLAVLSVLIILGLIFEAPWKVITLLLIVLAACRILPKPAIKWFWLSVGVVVIGLIIWVFLPEDTEGWRPYTFDEELAAIEAKRAIPDSENAAIIYKRLLEDHDPNTMSRDFLVGELERLTRSEPWSSKDHPEIAEWLKGQQSTIAALLKASKIEKYRFPIAADSAALSQTMKRLSAMRSWARLLLRAAYNDLGEDRTEQALEKQIALLQMAKHLHQQPTMIDMLVGIAIEALAIQQFNGFMVTGDATEAHLSVIEKALSEIKHDWASDLPRILECEKLMGKNMFCSMFYEVNPKGKTRLSRDPTAAIRAQFPQLPPEIRPLTYWQRKLAKASTVLGWFFLPRNPQKAGEIIDASFEKYYAMAKPNFDWQKEAREPSITSIRLNYRYLIEHLVGMPRKAYYRIHDIYLRITSDKRGSQLLIALRRYKNKNGYWPESLDDIKSLAPAEIFVDPVNDDSFVYKLTEENFTLYSKGKNNIDEGGQDKWSYDAKTGRSSYNSQGPDDWLIWPRRSRKTQEKKADAE